MLIREKGGKWYWEAMVNRRRYSGACQGCQTKAQAQAYAKEREKELMRLKEQRNVRALVENFREELTGGRKISLTEAFELAEAKPMRRRPSERQTRAKRSFWQDFLDFMEARHPEAPNLTDVTRGMAEEYIAQLRDEGRFTAKIRGNGKKKYTLQDKHITGRTVNIRHQAIRQVFDLLAEDAGLIANPFQAIPRMEQRPEKREAYSIEELKRIFEEADDFTRPLFLLAITTGLRRGDICTLQWREIDLERGIIVRRQHKTGQETTIPIMPQLRQFLIAQPRENEYVLPKQAEQYARNPETISRRIQATLRRSGITPKETVEGRGRAVIRKDLHSCRHTFCWLATQAGIPLTTVQAIVGHMTPEMTAYYSDHVTDAQKIAQVNMLSTEVMEGILGTAQGEKPPRARLQAAVNALPDDKVPEAIAAIENIMSR